MNGENTVRMTYGTLLSTIALAVAGLWAFADVSQATEANAAEIQHQKELSQQDRQFIKDQLKDIKELLKKQQERNE